MSNFTDLSYFTQIFTQQTICTNPDGSTYELPSVEEHLKTMNITPFPDHIKSIEDMLSRIPEKCKDIFFNSLKHVNPSHRLWHDETYGWHDLDCGHICSHEATQLGGDPEIAFSLGFLHDIGKSFCESKKGFTFGHGQVGAHLAEFLFGDINLELKEVLLFIIDQHMCSCTHSISKHDESYEILSTMISGFSDYQKTMFYIYFPALIVGDRLGKICENPMSIQEARDIAKQIINIKVAQTINNNGNKYYILLQGSQGCGKSYTSNKLKTLLSDLNINVAIAERDYEFYKEALNRSLISKDITFEQYVQEKINIKGKETTLYIEFYEELKKFIPESYKKTIEYYRNSNCDIILIDSCVCLHLPTIATLINSEENIIAYNGFPQHMLGRSGSFKMETQTFYPLKQEGCFYRSKIEGAPPTQKVVPLFCTSQVNVIFNFIKKIFSQRNAKITYNIVHPVTYLNSGKTLEDLKTEQKYILISTPTAYPSFDNYNVTRLSYADGTQHGDGPITHYRGEHIIEKEGIYYPLRVSLPVMPDTNQFNRFNTHAPIYNYVTGLSQFLPMSEFSKPKVIPETTKFNRCFFSSKVDGSLLVVFCVKKNSHQGIYLLNLKTINDNNLYIIEIEDSIICIGSRSCLLITQAVDYEKEFLECINATFSSVTNLAYLVKTYLDNLSWDETASVVFEMVPEHPHKGLTVDYNRYFTTHLSTILYSYTKNDNIVIKRPDELSKKYFNGVDVTEISCNVEDITNYYSKKIDEALEGKIEDLEGFMIDFTSDDGDLLTIKAKFKWFFASHNPDKHISEAEELLSHEKYSKINSRLVNLHTSSVKRDAYRNIDDTFKPFAILLTEAFLKFKTLYNPMNKKEFMIKFKENNTFFNTYPNINECIMEIFKKLDIKIESSIKLECSIDKIIPSLWDSLSKLTESDSTKSIGIITDYVIKAWKINRV